MSILAIALIVAPFLPDTDRRARSPEVAHARPFDIAADLFVAEGARGPPPRACLDAGVARAEYCGA